MAPTYKPLAVGASPTVQIEDPFALQAAFEKQQAAQQQQEAQQMQIAETRRKLEQDAKLREALVSQYGGGDSPVFDPDQALQTAQRLSLESGDLDTALNIEKITRERKNTIAPYGPEERAILSKELGYELPENADPRLVTTLTNLRGKNLYGQSLQDNRDKFTDQQDSLLPEGWEGNPTADDAKKFKTTLIGTQKVNGILDALGESLSRTGGEQATGAEYVLQRQLVGDLALELKSPAFGNLGAALSPSEYQLLLTQLPALLSTPETSLGRVLVERGLGRDPLDAIQALKTKISRNLDIEAPIRRMKRKTAIPQGEGLATAGASTANAPIMIPRASAPSAGGGIPRNPDGSLLTREQFMALRNQGQ